MKIQLTDSAAIHVRNMLSQRDRGVGLRLGMRKSGCSGYSYIVDYADAVSDSDIVLESAGIKLVVDRDSMPKLDGMTVDYVKTNVLNYGFEFRNPNEKNNCGCGESVSF